METKDTGDKARKVRVGILFGGKSAEHEVSIQSAKNVLAALDRNKFDPVLIGIDKQGQWHFDSSELLLGSGELEKLTSGSNEKIVTLVPGNEGHELVGAHGTGPKHQIDVVFPVLHGPMGEDGSIQGFLELADVPYVGPGILGSAVGMDKDVMKRLLRDGGINVTEFIVVTAPSKLDPKEVLERFGMPIFVKPANMGSSVGVTKVNAVGELRSAVDEAFQFDRKVLIEKALVGDEIECAVLGNEEPKASGIGRVIPNDKADGYYSYKAKYIDEKGAALEIPAKIDLDVAKKAQEVAIRAFKILECEGMSRVDMFALRDGRVFVNEINTIPGFTKISMYPKLWEVSGLNYQNLVTKLIELAVERYDARKRLKTTYEGHL